VRASGEQRRRILAEFERSGCSAAQFARRAGIKYSTFANWVQLWRRRPSRPARKSPVRLLEAMLDQSQQPGAVDQNKSPLVLHLPGGARVELSDVKQVPLAVALVRALGSPALSC
jgi:transposase-like protein